MIGLALLGGAFLGRGFEPYAGSALFGALGLGAFLLGRGMWRELTVLRHQRHLQALAEEVEVAKARAQAATEAARARGEAAPAEGGKKGGGADAAAEADALSYVGDEPTGEGASADADGDDAGQDA